MGGGKGGGAEYTKYFLSMHLALCHGPVDSVKEILVDEKTVYDTEITESDTVYIDKPDLFGGVEKQGGVRGYLDVLMGESTQAVNTHLQSSIDGNIPAFRGVLSFVLKNMYLAANNPYLKYWAAKVKRIPESSWESSYADINGGANAAHIIREALTNSSWGLGYSTTYIDDTSFSDFAESLYNESIGLSLVLSEQTTIEEFITEVLSHVNGIIYVDKESAKFVIKLIRDDYDSESLDVYNEDNIISLNSFERPQYSGNVNELIIKYKPQGTNDYKSLTIQNTASVQSQGGVVSQTIEYPGIDNYDVATIIAQRDIKQYTTPLAKINITVNRYGWDINPGDVFKFSWDELSISEMICRVVNINIGDLESGEIIVDAIEDIFSLPDTSYLTEQPPLWENPLGDAEAVTYQRAEEATYWDLFLNLPDHITESFDNNSSFYKLLAQKPDIATPNYELITKYTSDSEYTDQNLSSYTPTATLTNNLNYTDTTDISITSPSFILQEFTDGYYAYIDDEIIRIDSIDLTNNLISIGRGCLDSVTGSHAAGTKIWFAEYFSGLDYTEYTNTDSVDGKALVRTAIDLLDESDATKETLVMQARQNKPYPPGKLRLNTDAYPSSIQDHLDITWAHRDRTLQLIRPIISEESSDIGPETNVVYNLNLYDEDNNLKRSKEALDDTEYSWNTEIIDTFGIVGYDPPDDMLRDQYLGISLSTDFSISGGNSTRTIADNITNVSISGNKGIFSEGYFDIGYFSLSDTFSILLIFNPDIEDSIYTLISHCNSSGNEDNIVIAINPLEKKYYITVQDETQSTDIDVMINTSDNAVLFCVDQSGTGTEINIYNSDGLIDTLNFTYQLSSTSTGYEWSIGQNYDSGVRSSKYSGSMSDILFYNRILNYYEVFQTRLNENIRLTLESTRDSVLSHQQHDYSVNRDMIPFNTVVPTITETPFNFILEDGSNFTFEDGDNFTFEIGSTVYRSLVSTDGTWDYTPTSYTYQWRRNGIDISAETNNEYEVTTYDAGSYIDCMVTAINIYGNASIRSEVILIDSLAPFLGTWTNRIPVYINSNYVDSDLTHFPVPIVINSSTGGLNQDLTNVFDELSYSFTGDDFSGEDGDAPDADLWSTITSTNGSCKISSNKLNVQIASPSAEEYTFAKPIPVFPGDFDIQVDLSDLVATSIGAGGELLFVIDSNNKMYIKGLLGPSTDEWFAYSIISGSASADSVLRSNSDGRLRLVRSGSTVTLYYDDGNTGSWTLLHTRTGFSTDAGNIRLAVWTNEGAVSANFDNFQINSGTVIWPGTTHPNRKKIAITTDDGTSQIYGEIEMWDAYNENAVIWVSKNDLDISSSSDTLLYLYYDSSQSDNTSYIGDIGDTVSQNVWDSYFASVFHMSQDPSGGTNCILDSTSNGNHGTPAGSMITSDVIDGQIGKALSFDGIDDYIDVGDITTMDGATSFTLEWTGKFDSLSTFDALICKFAAGQQAFNLTTGNISDEFRVEMNDSTQTAGLSVQSDSVNLIIDTDYVLSSVWNGTNQIDLYVNGIEVSSSIINNNSPVSVADVTEHLSLMAKYNAGSPTDFCAGQTSEIRLSTINRSSAWIKATNYATNNNLLFFGVPELQ
jgi:hypothetical protein